MQRPGARTASPGCSAFTGTVDIATALAGAVVATLGVYLAGPLLGWAGEQRHFAALFGAALLLSTGSTPNGILRLFNRFDLITVCEAIAPVVRLVGSVTVWWLGGEIAAFLAVWAAATFLQMIAQWIVALTLTPARLQFGRSAFSGAVAENSRLWRFMLQTNLSNSLSLFWSQLGILAVGAVAGARHRRRVPSRQQARQGHRQAGADPDQRALSRAGPAGREQ